MKIDIKKIIANNGQIEGVPKNPRFIKDERFEKLKKSIQDTPELLELRELIVYPFDDKYIVIAGNMRFRAMKELGYKECQCKVLDANMEALKIREIAIKDNRPFGSDDFDLLANEWDMQELLDFGYEEFEFGISSFEDKNKEIDVNDFSDKMILKFELSESDYSAVKSKLQMISNDLNKALMDLINGQA